MTTDEQTMDELAQWKKAQETADAMIRAEIDATRRAISFAVPVPGERLSDTVYRALALARRTSGVEMAVRLGLAAERRLPRLRLVESTIAEVLAEVLTEDLAQNTVYLAALYRRREQLGVYRTQLESLGFEVTSRWLDESANCYTFAERQARAMDDWRDLANAATVISFTEEPSPAGRNRGGRHVEFGAALAMGKRCLVVGRRENVFHTLPQVTAFETWEEAMQLMSTLMATLKVQRGCGSEHAP